MNCKYCFKPITIKSGDNLKGGGTITTDSDGTVDQTLEFWHEDCTPAKPLMLNGKQYMVQVKQGERYIDGMTSDEFIAQADKLTVLALALKGADVLKHEAQE